MSLFSRVRNSLFGPSQPKNSHSLENLKYLCGVLNRNLIVTDLNCDLLTETLRSISEILIWGDQHDSSVFDYFLERGMLNDFLTLLNQPNGRYICVQILQTLNILFENIRDQTSLYYLLSNNHVNNIILHKFDFSDEEITAYYISFLKTLSLKLNKHSINFFYNENNNNFPLYVEAIKFFNHPETMVRIAVRTLTLNVYKVPDESMRRFILDCTATAYFSNLVWFIRNHVLDFDALVRNNRDISNLRQLNGSLEEYLDHIHYLQDIFMLNVASLNNVLKDQLMNRLLIPMYIFSLIKRGKFSRIKDSRVMLDRLSAFFLVAECFLVIQHRPLVEEMADIILSADIETVESIQRRYGEQISYSLPPTSLENCLAANKPNNKNEQSSDTGSIEISLKVVDINDEDERRQYEDEHSRRDPTFESSETGKTNVKTESLYVSNWTDDEKCRRSRDTTRLNDKQTLADRPYFQELIQALDCDENDQLCFYALSILLSMTTNPSIDRAIIESVCLTVQSKDKSFYNVLLVNKLCNILHLATVQESKIRVVTLNLAITLLKELVYDKNKKKSYLLNHHLSVIDQTRKQATENLRRYYPVEQQELLLDMFEDEYRQTQLNTVRIENLLKDARMLFPPTTTPLSGVEFIKRLPSGDIEKARRSIRVFLLIRELFLELNLIIETELPLTKPENLFKIDDEVDFQNCDLIACTVHMQGRKDRRFLVIDEMQFILVEPDIKRLNWGIVRFCDLMQDVEVTNDKEDSRSLHITIHKTVHNIYVKTSPPILNAKFTFDDHIRCMTAKQNLMRARQKARQIKLSKIAAILEIETAPVNITHQPRILTAQQHQIGTTAAALSNHPGRATLISSSKRQTSSSSIPISHRPINSYSTSVSSTPFNNVEHIRSYSLSRTHSDQSSEMTNHAFTATSSRRTSMSDVKEKTRRGSSQMARAPKSLREWHEQPVNLLQQPQALDKVNVQILSPNIDRTNSSFFNTSERSKSEDTLNIEVENDTTDQSTHAFDVNKNI